MNHLYTGPFKNEKAEPAMTAETRTTLGGAEVSDILRGLMVVVAGALMILPAYINYELWHRGNFDITVSMSIGLVSFALGILIFVLVIGKERIEGPRKP